jgi:ribosomal protein S18 acetylase RimI-like enzyme
VIVAFHPKVANTKALREPAPHDDLTKTFEIKTVATAPSYQGKGVMKLLFHTHLMRYLSGREGEKNFICDNASEIKVWLEVASKRGGPAWRTYLEAGFHVWSSFELKYTDTEHGKSKCSGSEGRFDATWICSPQNVDQGRPYRKPTSARPALFGQVYNSSAK